MPTGARPPTEAGKKDQTSPGDAAPGASPGARRAAGGRVFERIRETIDSVARQMGARRRNLARLDRGR